MRDRARTMRLAVLAALTVACLAVTAVPAARAAEAKRFEPVKIGTYFLAGSRHTAKIVGEWLAGIIRALTGMKGKGGQDAVCEDQSGCAAGLSCLNVCDDDDCAVYRKRCIKGPDIIRVIPEFGACGPDNVCASGTACTRTCPDGAFCRVSHRCLKPEVGEGACTGAEDCRSLCGRRGFPPVGPTALLASCRDGACRCRLLEADPEAPIAECSAGAEVALCPEGSRAACTTSGASTCLKAPEFGGQCLADAECAKVGCSEGAAPFCDPSDRRCRCRSSEFKAIACQSVVECSAVTCEAGQEVACVGGSCGCTATLPPTSACETAADCSADCPTGYVPACVDKGCACQRRVENVPVACVSVQDCGVISCPEGYEKACVDAKCACTRTVPQ
jgi:hypothetical protein